LDIPETALIGIFDADKEGFLRSARSLIQTIGRAARNSEGRVILYGDRITPSMQKAMDETARRRKIQAAHNEKHNITPTTISKKIHDSFRPGAAKQTQELADFAERFKNTAEIEKKILELNDKMKQSARELDFEGAVKYRDEVRRLKRILIS
jgi:excinuclease ABC subunit B